MTILEIALSAITLSWIGLVLIAIGYVLVRYLRGRSTQLTWLPRGVPQGQADRRIFAGVLTATVVVWAFLFHTAMRADNMLGLVILIGITWLVMDDLLKRAI